MDQQSADTKYCPSCVIALESLLQELCSIACISRFANPVTSSCYQRHFCVSFRAGLKTIVTGRGAAVGLNGPGKIPRRLVKTIFERFFSVTDNDGQPYSNPVAFNYQQLLNKTDDVKSTGYYPEQYLRAVQNPSMRTHLYHLCVKHPSEWYYSSEAPIWKSFLSPEMKKESPEWYAYSVKYLTDIRWMHRVAGTVENPWHLHPLVFPDTISQRERCKELFSKISGVILRHEGGYVNDPDDKGGETNMGITIGTWKRFSMKDLSIPASSETLKAMTKIQAEIVYYNNFWKPNGFCKLESTKIALMIYDWTITARWAIREVRTLLHNEYDNRLNVSNVMNDDMINCINNIDAADAFLDRLGQVRKEYYKSLTVTNGKSNSQIKYLKGWRSRVDDCLGGRYEICGYFAFAFRWKCIFW